MSSIATTTNGTPLQYPSSTLIDRDKSTGYLYCLLRGTTANTYDLYRSINGGTSWSLRTSLTRSNLTEMGSIFIGPDGWLRWVYRTNESSQDRIYIRGMNLDTGVWETELLLASPGNGGVAGAYHTGIDLWATITSTAEYYCVAVGTVIGASGGVTLYGAYTPSIPGTTVSANSIIRGTRQWLSSGTGRQTPSIDAQHNSDGKTASTPSLWVAFGRTAAYVAKLSWMGDGWNGPSSPVTLATGIGTRDYMPGRWDGDRFLVAVPNGSVVDLYERDKSNTATTKRTSSAHSQGVIRSLTLSYNKVTRDTRVFAVGTTINDLYYSDFVRSTALWSGWAAVSTDDVLTGGSAVDQFTVRRSTYGNSKYDVAQGRAAAPQVQHNQLGLAYAPNPPTWNFGSVPYQNGGAADVNASLLLDWDFNDPDAADAQTAFAVSRQIGAGALSYWRASDSTWQVAEVKNVSGTSAITLASGWAAGGDANYTYRAKTWDVADTASAYSDGLVLVPSVKVNPTITSPGATVTQDSVTMTWTVGEQTAFRATIEIFGFVLQDSGWVAGSALSFLSPERLENGFSYTVKLQTKNNEGLASDIVSQSFTVVFTVPQVPATAATPNSSGGFISVAITNPGRAFINAGSAANANNAAVVPGLPAGITPDVLQLLVCIAAIRNSGTGSINLIAGWSDVVNFGNVRIMSKLYVTGDTAPTVGITSGAAGADVSAQIIALRGVTTSVLGTPGTVLNGSAQNIATPAETITTGFALALMAGWKQGISTGATFPAGWTKVVDISTAVGTGQSLSLAYQLQTTATNIGVDTITMAGGAVQISRGVVAALAGAPDIASNDLYRLESGGAGNGVRVAAGVAAGGTVQDWRARSGVDYSYRALARSAIGTSTYGVWTP